MGVTSHCVLQGEPQLLGQRGQPGQHIPQLVELFSRAALAHGLGQFAKFLGEPGHGGGDAALPVLLAIGVGHEPLQISKLHPSTVGGGEPPVGAGEAVPRGGAMSGGGQRVLFEGSAERTAAGDTTITSSAEDRHCL